MVEKFEVIKHTKRVICKDCNCLEDCKEALKEGKIILFIKERKNCRILNNQKEKDEFIRDYKKIKEVTENDNM